MEYPFFFKYVSKMLLRSMTHFRNLKVNSSSYRLIVSLTELPYYTNEKLQKIGITDLNSTRNLEVLTIREM